ncbi:methylmalonyl-CoA mutase family protein [Arundinibacter roseus]|uniref:Methylmalonyl-CoA mutase n=1 Tax=Arundinibacter roseus TaxID=2070510 RepID=A0A4R4KC43_9BACT|nr:methylmalonyl-CoA mutase family protein [Arundinibacter roseus]TDB65213.1 methylmalonyl-CoA mutase [Arundinibacter roseus]
MSFSLVSDFGKADKSSWKKQVEQELRGRTYEDTWYKPAKNVSLEPYFVADETENNSLIADIRACQKKNPGWLTIPSIRFNDPKVTNELMRYQLDRGADGMWISASETGLLNLELSKTLHTIRLTDTPIFLDSSENPSQLIAELSRNSAYYLKGGLVYDPLANWMKHGKPYEAAVQAVAEGMSLTKAMKEFRSYKVESHVFHEAGADVVQELAFTMASFVTYMDLLTGQGVSALLAANRVVFSIAIGTNYLTELAKLRALRYLYRQVTRAYGLPDELCQAFIQAQSSRFYQSVHAPHTNLVRHTAEAMSAVSGGCDALTILPFDQASSEPSEFSERIARNISLVLKHESYLEKVADPAGGAYYLELLTQKIATASWDLFLEIEEKGGLVPAFQENFIQDRLAVAWTDQKAAYQSTEKRIVGQPKQHTLSETGLPERKENKRSSVLISTLNLLPSYTLDDLFA